MMPDFVDLTDIEQTILDTPVGSLLIAGKKGFLISVDFISAKERQSHSDLKPLSWLSDDFRHYFENPKYRFDLPMKLVVGTAFQQRVWQALTEIPSGKVVSYGELARRLDTSARAVGNACRANPCPIIIPCHRVVSAAGLGGYGGHTDGPVLDRKRWLLRHEGVIDE